jgi:hypothetical protein
MLLAIFFVAFPSPAVGQERLIDCYVNCNATFQFGEQIHLPSSCIRQRMSYCYAFTAVDFVHQFVFIILIEPKDLIPLPPGIPLPSLMHSQRMVLYRDGSHNSLEFHLGVACNTSETCAMDFVQRRVQYLIEKLSSSMPQFWTSVDDAIGGSLTTDSHSSSLECYQPNGGKENCKSNENHCQLFRVVVIGNIINTLPNVTIPSEAGCTNREARNTAFVEIATIK